MNSSNNGINTKLEIFKESTKKRNDKAKKLIYIKFILIFLISHSLRSILIENSPTQEVAIIKLQKGYLRLKIKAESFLNDQQVTANLFHKSKHLEIENVHIISRELGVYELDIKSEMVSIVLENQNDWQLIPRRKIQKKTQRKAYEIVL